MRHSPAEVPVTPPHQYDTVHRELRPGTGKGASASAGPMPRYTRQTEGRTRAPPTPPPAPPQHPHTTSPPPTTTVRGNEDILSVVSNQSLHCVMQERCHHTSASDRIPSWPPMPPTSLQRAATVRREKVQLRIREQSFFAREGRGKGRDRHALAVNFCLINAETQNLCLKMAAWKQRTEYYLSGLWYLRRV